jgi:hypothetical protein
LQPVDSRWVSLFDHFDSSECHRLAVILAPFRFQEVAGLDLVQAEIPLDLPDQGLAAAVIVAVVDHRSVDSDPAGCDVDVIAMADGHIAVVAHSFGPAAANLGPLLVGQLAIFGADPERLVNDGFAEGGPELAELAKFLGELSRGLACQGSADDVCTWARLAAGVLLLEQVTDQAAGASALVQTADHSDVSGRPINIRRTDLSSSVASVSR